MPIPQKGQRFGGRAKGTPNKATTAREEAARAQIAAAVRRSPAAVDPRDARQEFYKLASIAEGFAAKFRPRDITQDQEGKLVIVGGDMKQFGEWFDRLKDVVFKMAEYQLPRYKAIEIPAPPPDPNASLEQPRKRFELRIFEGGRPITPMGNGKDTAA
jgi:hypothetical protein